MGSSFSYSGCPGITLAYQMCWGMLLPLQFSEKVSIELLLFLKCLLELNNHIDINLSYFLKYKFNFFGRCRVIQVIQQP